MNQVRFLLFKCIFYLCLPSLIFYYIYTQVYFNFYEVCFITTVNCLNSFFTYCGGLQVCAQHVTDFLSLKTSFIDCFFIYYFYLLFLFVIIFSTVFQTFLSFLGIFYIMLISCLFLFFILAVALFNITQWGVIPFIEFKIYSIYIPTFMSSIVFSLDYLSAAFMFLVVAIAIAAISYTRVYLFGDPNISDFTIKLVWFVFSMLSLVLTKNFVFLYFSWEFIGITSMWLINFNSQRLDTNKSALKAFFFNKISDLCLFSALLLGVWVFNSPTITDWKLDVLLFDCNYLVTLGVLLSIAASIKSAQLGFHLWLPDSMDAPVPASALIHSATLVSAGIYLLLRFSDIFQFANLSQTISILGALTAVYGGVVAGMQTDLKRALAYSTISHCGFLFIASTIGGSSIALLYLFLHGFYKALSFICAGEAIRVNMGYQDLNKMGGFFFICPSLTSQFFIAMGNLCGLPFFIGYLFKYNFQILTLTNSIFNFFFNFLLICGFLSSLLYFFKVFYMVAFSFKKNNFKAYTETYRQGFYKFTFSIKTPKVLILIFWFVICCSGFCISILFNYSLKTLNCSYLDDLNLILGFSYLIDVSDVNFKLLLLSYFFFFYIFFSITCVLLYLIYLQRRVSSEFILLKFIWYVVSLITFYIFLI